MKVTFTIATVVEVDPAKVKEMLGTEGLLASESAKVLKDKVWRILDEEYSEHGRFGDYTREVRDEIKEVVEDLGVLSDKGANPQLKVSRPQNDPDPVPETWEPFDE